MRFVKRAKHDEIKRFIGIFNGFRITVVATSTRGSVDPVFVNRIIESRSYNAIGDRVVVRD